MTILYALLCEDASTRQDGRLDVHGVFHQLYAPGFPARQDRMVLALAIEWNGGEQGRKEFRIDLLDRADSPILTINGHTDVTPSPGGQAPSQTRLIMPLENVVFPETGSYRFVLKLEGADHDLVPIHLVQDPDA